MSFLARQDTYQKILRYFSIRMHLRCFIYACTVPTFFLVCTCLCVACDCVNEQLDNDSTTI